MAETSVLDQNKKAKAPAKAEKAEKSSGGSVLDSKPAANKKPITFYKKAWFWIIIAVVVLGVAGLIVFLVIQANITAEAIEKYGKNAKAASTALEEYQSAYSNVYSDSGLAGYYSRYKDDDSRPTKLIYKCVGEFGVDEDTFKTINNIEIFDGEKAVDELGSGKTRELSEKFEKAAENLKKAKADMKSCEDILAKTLEDDYDISFGEFKIIEGRWYNDSELKVTVKNTSDTSMKFYFKIAGVDSSDEQIDTDTFYTKILSAGEEAEYTIFDYVSDAKMEKLKDAKFKVVAVDEYN